VRADQTVAWGKQLPGDRSLSLRSLSPLPLSLSPLPLSLSLSLSSLSSNFFLSCFSICCFCLSLSLLTHVFPFLLFSCHPCHSLSVPLALSPRSLFPRFPFGNVAKPPPLLNRRPFSPSPPHPYPFIYLSLITLSPTHLRPFSLTFSPRLIVLPSPVLPCLVSATPVEVFCRPPPIHSILSPLSPYSDPVLSLSPSLLTFPLTRPDLPQGSNLGWESSPGGGGGGGGNTYASPQKYGSPAAAPRHTPDDGNGCRPISPVPVC
jgi:hypothetical protein